MTPPPPPPPPRPTGPPRPPSVLPVLRVDSPALKPEEAGDRIGRYKLLQQIGEGGFGVVWMAEQEVPVRRRVALKIIKLGMDTKQVIARFEAERQALAMMDHPNIAKVLDAGATQTGRPFFVMELVRGIRITEFCDQSKLAAADRLGLFVQVCHAVQHAHQKGIIHRDLKPSNILVTLHDGVPVPKVIDFGVAKATQARLTDLTLFTQFDQMVGTPLYMSPEQAEMSGLDVDTRTDIYSLGVLLYELLTGRTPFDAEELARRGLDEMRRAIRETDPPRPSTRFSTLAVEARSTVANQRQAEPAKLMGLLRGDLDWVVMKALEKDRTRRYETANGFAMDVKRFLSGELVVARPPSSAYRLQKLVRRNKLAFAAGAAVALALIAAITAGAWQAMRAGREKKRAASAVAQLAETAPAFADEARALAARGQFDEAIEKLAFAARLRPDVADYAARQGDIRESQLRIADALEAYRAALKIAPNHARAKANALVCARLAELKFDRAKPPLEVLAPLHAIMQREQRGAGELAPVAKLFAAEKQRVLGEWTPKVASIAISAGKPMSERIFIGDDGRLALDLADSGITDLTPLAALPLSALTLAGCKGVTDLRPLAGLQLTQLTIGATGVTDLSPLAKMNALTELNMVGTKVADLSPLAGLRLTHLLALQIPAQDYAPLAAMPLEVFWAGPQFRDLTLLRHAPLRKLNVGAGTSLRGFAALAEIKTLEELVLPVSSVELPEAEFAAVEKLREHPVLREITMTAAAGSAVTPMTKQQFWKEWERNTLLMRALRTAGIQSKSARWLNGAWYLDFSGEKLSDLSVLKGQPVAELVLDGTGIANLEPLRGMPLETLRLAGCPVSDLAPLANMPLKSLWMDASVTATAFSPLATLSLLETVLLPPQALDIAALRNLPKLRRISYTAANDEPACTAEDFWKAWDGLAWLRALREAKVAHAATQRTDGGWDVAVTDANFADASIFKGATSLRTLKLAKTKVADLAALRGIPLVALDVSETKVADLSPLAEAPLEELMAYETPVADLAVLRSPVVRAALKTLRVWDTNITDFSAMSGCEKLDRVSVSGKALTSLDVFKDLKLLRMLHINRTAISDISSVAAMPLEEFVFRDTPVTDIRPLLACPTLQRVGLPIRARNIELLRAHPVIKQLDYVQNFNSGGNARTAEQFWAEWDESGGIPALAAYGDLKTWEQCSEAAKFYGEALDRLRAERPPRDLPIRIATARLAVVAYRWGEIEMSGKRDANAAEKVRWAQSLIANLPAEIGDTKNVNHLRDLVSLRGRMGDWPRTLTALARVDELAPGSTAERARLIPLYLEAGDYDRYNALREQVSDSGAKSTGSVGVTRTVHMLGVLPSLGDSARVAKMLENGAADARIQQDYKAELQLAQGVAVYRAGRFADAIEPLAQVATDTDRWKRAFAFPALAMAHHRLGHATEAAAALDAAAKARKDLLAYRAELGFGSGKEWHNVLAADLLRREAVAALAEPLAREGNFRDGAKLARTHFANDGSPLDRMILCTLLVAAGDTAGYRTQCADILKKFGTSPTPGDGDRIAKSLLLSSGAGVDEATVASLIAAAKPMEESDALRPYFTFVSGLAEFRAGRFEKAAELLTRVANEERVHPACKSAASSVLAMTEHRRNRSAESLAAFNAAREIVASKWPDGSESNWHDWLIADLLSREAGALLGQPLPPVKVTPVAFKPAEPEPAGPKPAPALAPAGESAESLARAGKFAEAARLSRERIERAGKEAVPGFNESADRLILATTLLAAGDRDGYRAACAELVRHLKDNTASDHAERMGKACLLAPDSGIEPAALAAIVATAQPGLEKRGHSMWVQLLNTLAEYRAGHFDTAADWVVKLRANPECPPRGIAAADAILAMAEHRRQRPAEARTALESAQKTVAANWPAGGEGAWYAWLIADLLTKEATALLK